jgi:membrane protein DedA with SNARE-associated domain
VEESNIIINSIGGLQYGGLFVLALMANMIIPVPEEVILLVSGYLVGTGHFNYLTTALIFLSGMYMSDIGLFYLSRKGNKFVEKLKSKIKNKNFLQDEDFVKRHIKKIIFGSRFLVYIRFIGPVLAGSTKTKWSTFLFYDFIALLIYVPFVLFIGKYFHKNISSVLNGVSVGRNIALTIILIILGFILLKYINKKFIKDFSQKVSSYIPTIIPGLSKKEADKDLK